jgi:hypothetical protein
MTQETKFTPQTQWYWLGQVAGMHVRSDDMSQIAVNRLRARGLVARGHGGWDRLTRKGSRTMRANAVHANHVAYAQDA